MSNLTKEQLVAWDSEYVVHSWSKQKGLNPIPVEKSAGIYFWDYDGKRYADMCSQLVNMNLGHGNKEIIQAIKDQADKMPFIAPGLAVDTRAELAKKIVELAPKGMKSVFFTNAGADANENAVKIARSVTGRGKVLSMYRSYHGATIAAGNLSGDSRRFSSEIGGNVAGFIHFDGPFSYRDPIADKFATDREYGDYMVGRLETVIINEGVDKIAAIVLEPIVGANGVIIPPEGYMQGVRALCDKYGIMMICDEVMCAFGRTGTMFGVNHWNVCPDMLVFAKGVTCGYVQLGGVIVNGPIRAWCDDNVLGAGLTYQGHPLACAAGIACIDYIIDNNILDHVNKVGKVLGELLEELKAKHACLGDVRYIGLFSALDLVIDKATKEPIAAYGVDTTGNQKKVLAKCKEKGFYTYGRDNCIQVCPPLIITEAELREQMVILDEVLTWADQQFCK